MPLLKIDAKVDGKDVKVPNLTYEEWYAKEQQFLSFILGSLG